MPNYKNTYFFNGGNTGWTESFYVNAATHADASALALGSQIERRDMLGSGITFLGVRTSDVRITGDSIYAVQPPADVAGGPLPPTLRDTSWQAAVIRIEATPLYRRGFSMRGLPDDFIVRDANNEFPVPGVLRARVTRWIDRMKTLQYKLRVRSKEAADLNNVIITNMVFAGDKITITANAHGLNPSTEMNQVRISGGNWIGGLKVKGIFQVLPPTDLNSFTIAYPLGGGPAPVYLGGAFSSRVVIIYVNITAGIPQRFAWRKTGRPFGLFHGRLRRL